MDNLRLILFVSGILGIAAIYIWEIFRERRASIQRLDIFDESDDVSLRRDSPGDGFYADADLQQYRGRPGPMTADAKDKVILGEVGALDGHEPPGPSRATVSDEARITPVEEDALVEEDVLMNDTLVGDIPPPQDGEIIETASGSRQANQDPSADADVIDADVLELPPKDRTDRTQPEKPRPQAIQERGRYGGSAGGGRHSRVRELVIALTIMARSDREFSGHDIREGFESAGMHLGDMRIFHYFGAGRQPTERPIFSAADILEPGAFPVDNFEEHSTKGLILFMQLPGPLDGLVAFEEMLSVAQNLAKSLGGELCDDTRSTLTTQAANHLRERIEELKRRQLF